MTDEIPHRSRDSRTIDPGPPPRELPQDPQLAAASFNDRWQALGQRIEGQLTADPPPTLKQILLEAETLVIQAIWNAKVTITNTATALAISRRRVRDALPPSSSSAKK